MSTAYPLSPLQQGMLFHWLREPEAGVDLEQIGCTLHGVDVPRFLRAWEHVTARHPALRTRFRWEHVDAPVQEVLDAPRDAPLDAPLVPLVPLAVHEEDVRALDAAAQRQRVAAYLDADRQRGFRLDALPLFRLAFFRSAEDRHEFVWSFPHLILDGRSFILVLREVLATYRALAAGTEPALPTPRPYRDFIAWLEGQDPAPAAAYWAEALRGFAEPVVPDLGADSAVHALRTANPARLLHGGSAPVPPAGRIRERSHP